MSFWSQKFSIRTPLLIIGLVELAVLLSSAYVSAYLTYGQLGGSVDSNIGLHAGLLTGVIFLCLIAMGLYQFHQRLRFREIVIRILVALTFGWIGLSALIYVLPSVSIGVIETFYAVTYALVLIVIARLVFLRTVDDNIFRRRVLIFGGGERASFISRLRRRADRRGFKVVGSVNAPGDRGPTNGSDEMRAGQSLAQFASELQADEIVVAMDERRGNLPIRDLLDARLSGIDVIDLVDFLERETGKIQVDLANPGWLIFSEGFRISVFRKFCQRCLDLVISSILLLVTWPIMIVVAVAIKIEDGLQAPVFYRQRRVGYLGKQFLVMKFRSMQINAEPDGRAVWAEENDPRVTRVGGFIRKFRIDELPQVFNVLLGTMSLVGPRPERPEFVCELQNSIPYYGERHAVNPGVTGWAQLRYSYGSTDEDALEKLQYDLYYVKNQSLLLDIMIMLQTVEVVFWGKGAR